MAVTVAERAPPSSSDNSPNISPGPMMLRVLEVPVGPASVTFR
jgi:hypothetical protein